MSHNPFHGVLPAILTPFSGKDGQRINYEFLGAEAVRLCELGCSGVVWPGSMGEWQTLPFDEKVQGWTALRAALDSAKLRGKVLIGAIASHSTAEAVALAKAAKKSGADGLMVLPPSGYSPALHEGVLTHFATVMNATDLPSMVYNNPPAYKVDLTVSDYHELLNRVRGGKLAAVKESHPNPMQIHTLRQGLPPRINVLVGLDGNIFAGVLFGACGWIAGLPVALPLPCLKLYDYARTLTTGHGGLFQATRRLFSDLKPLFDLDARPDLVECFKHCMTLAGIKGFEPVRAPRLPLTKEQKQELAALWKKFQRVDSSIGGL